MTRHAPLYVSEAGAARLLDMTLAEFRALVKAGHLPRGREIAPGVLRWEVEELRQIGRGDAVDGGIAW